MFKKLLLILLSIIWSHALYSKSNSKISLADFSVSSMSPNVAFVGDTVVFRGTGFETIASTQLIVYFVNKSYLSPGVFRYDSIVSNIVDVTSDKIRVLIPERAIYGLIAMSIDNRSIDLPELYFGVDPKITSVVPSSASVGDTITVFGTGFNTNGQAVRFDPGLGAIAFNVLPTSLKVVVPLESISGRLSTLRSNVPFTVIPKAESLNPSSETVGRRIQILGTGFEQGQLNKYKVLFNGIEAELYLVSPNVIDAIVPHKAASGIVTVYFNGYKIGGQTLFFSVIPTKPKIKSVSVGSGFVGDEVKIIGSDFDQSGPPLTVDFGGTLAEIIHYTNDTIITKVPKGAITGEVSVKAGGLKESMFNFIFQVKEKVDRVFPLAVRVGDTITVAGSGFFYLNSEYYRVQFQPSTIVYPVAVSDSTLRFVIPNASITGQPTLYGGAQLSILAKLPEIRIIPVINSISPDTIIAGRQQKIIIRGTGLAKPNPSSSYKLIFEDKIAQSEISHNAYNNDSNSGYNEIRATVPAGVTKSGPIALVIDNHISYSSLNLVVLPDTFPYKPNPPERIFAISNDETSFTFQWNKPYRAIGYMIDVSRDNFVSFESGLKSLSVKDSITSIVVPLKGIEYQFRIRSYSNTDTSSYSYTYKTSQIPITPIAQIPVVFSQKEYLIQWTESPGSVGYIVDFSLDLFKNFESLIAEENPIGIRIIDENVVAFSYRVRAFNYFGISSYSNIISVITEVKSSNEDLSLYPNPTSDNIILKGISIDVIGAYIVDMNGRTQEIKERKEPNNDYFFDVNGLPAGVYVLYIKTLNGNHRFKFSKTD